MSWEVLVVILFLLLIITMIKGEGNGAVYILTEATDKAWRSGM